MLCKLTSINGLDKNGIDIESTDQDENDDSYDGVGKNNINF